MCKGPAVGWFISESVAQWLKGCQWPSTSSLWHIAGGCIEDLTSSSSGMFLLSIIVLVGCAHFCPHVHPYNSANFGSDLRAGWLLRCTWMHSHRSLLFWVFSRKMLSAWASSRRSALLLLKSVPLNTTVGPHAAWAAMQAVSCSSCCQVASAFFLRSIQPAPFLSPQKAAADPYVLSWPAGEHHGSSCVECFVEHHSKLQFWQFEASGCYTDSCKVFGKPFGVSPLCLHMQLATWPCMSVALLVPWKICCSMAGFQNDVTFCSR